MIGHEFRCRQGGKKVNSLVVEDETPASCVTSRLIVVIRWQGLHSCDAFAGRTGFGEHDCVDHGGSGSRKVDDALFSGSPRVNSC